MSAIPQTPLPRRTWDRATVVRDLHVSLTLLAVGAFLWVLTLLAGVFGPPVGEGDMIFHGIVGNVGATLTWMGAIFAAWNGSILRDLPAPPGSAPSPPRAPPLGLPPPQNPLPPPPWGFPAPPATIPPPPS